MVRLKEYVLRELGDHGADTLERYFAQIQYTAYWCIRMLRSCEGIEAVIPEGGEDLVIIRRGNYELHQVKTRSESRGPWTIAEVLPILYQQYHRRKIFPKCNFHFISDQIADIRATAKLESLYRLKLLLEIEHSGQTYCPEEKEDLKNFENILGEKIQNNMHNKYNDPVDISEAVALLHNTHIETQCCVLRAPHNMIDNNVIELNTALEEAYPGIPSYTINQLNVMYNRLIMLIINKITKTASIDERHIRCDSVLNCQSAIINISHSDYLDLNLVPGKTNLDKKAYLGGFDLTEIPRFHRQKLLAEAIRRRYLSLGMEYDLERLSNAILEKHAECRDIVCRVDGIYGEPGPRILSMLKPELASIASKYFPEIKEIDDLFCIGLLWRETDRCYAWWNSLKNSA